MGFDSEYSATKSLLSDGLLKATGDSGKRDRWFEERSLEVFEFQRRWNEGYRRFCDRREVADWKLIPAVPTTAFKNASQPVTCFPVEEAAGYFETSGTTGETKGRHYFYEFDTYRSAIELSLAPLAFLGVPMQLPMYWLPGLGEHSSLRFMFEHLCGSGPVEKIEFDRPVMLMGTALSFLNLFEMCFSWVKWLSKIGFNIKLLIL